MKYSKGRSVYWFVDGLFHVGCSICKRADDIIFTDLGDTISVTGAGSVFKYVVFPAQWRRCAHKI